MISHGDLFIYFQHTYKRYIQIITVNPEGIGDLDLPRRVVGEDGEHVQKLVEAECGAALAGKHFADPPPERVLLRIYLLFKLFKLLTN